jgi:hypothetical protein
MKIKSIGLAVCLLSIHALSLNAQSCDTWIIQVYKQLYGRVPNSNECNIKNYNNGSWNSYDQLKEFIRKFQGNGGSTGLAKTAATGNCTNKSYYGICQIAEFTNDDFRVQKTTCGQAAAVTALWHAGLNITYNDAGRLATEFYALAPPRITVPGIIEVRGGLGTDWRQIERGLNAFARQGISYNWQKGKSALQNELRKSNVCLIMIDTGTLPQYKYAWGTGHWVTAYGYDDTYVYVTNFPDNKMTWGELHKAWGGSATEGHLAKAHGKAEMFATVWKQ